ncbi:MAG: hypothetical protein AB1546_01405, partial [bacterium]
SAIRNSQNAEKEVIAGSCLHFKGKLLHERWSRQAEKMFILIPLTIFSKTSDFHRNNSKKP